MSMSDDSVSISSLSTIPYVPYADDIGNIADFEEESVSGLMTVKEFAYGLPPPILDVSRNHF
jgi:hypothetical protein